ncbi:MAG: hypothetical protein ACLU9S_10660 [Oscillospiraceae bacterium]
MTVEPGFSGQAFIVDMMPKLQTIRRWIQERNLPCILEVDGGVGPSTFQTCLDHGADLLVAGSAYFRAPDRTAFVKQYDGAKQGIWPPFPASSHATGFWLPSRRSKIRMACTISWRN